jgi:hypothetical protein
MLSADTVEVNMAVLPTLAMPLASSFARAVPTLDPARLLRLAKEGADRKPLCLTSSRSTRTLASVPSLAVIGYRWALWAAGGP